MEFRLPELGEGVYEAELVSWLVKPGDVVKRGQNLIEVLTDKATMEVPSPFAGKITDLLAEPGQRIKVGDVVLNYAAGASEPSETTSRSATKPRLQPNGRLWLDKPPRLRRRLVPVPLWATDPQGPSRPPLPCATWRVSLESILPGCEGPVRRAGS